MHLIRKYEMPDLMLENRNENSNFSPSIKNLQSKVAELIEKIFQQKEKSKDEFYPLERIENLKTQLNSIRLHKSQFLEPMWASCFSNQDDDLNELIERFIQNNAFDQALEAILEMIDVERKYDKLAKLVVFLSDNQLKIELSKIIDSVVSFDFITSRDIQHLYNKLNEECFSKLEGRVCSLEGLVQHLRLKEVCKLYHLKIKEKYNDIELLKVSNHFFKKSSCIVL